MNNSVIESTTPELATPALDLEWARAQFPSLRQEVNGHPATFLDGPGGTQVPHGVIEAIAQYLRTSNANTRGAFATSRASDAILYEARQAMADLLASGPDEVVFGPNMTSLTFAVSRALGRELEPGDEIVVTQLDHDANVSPWRALQERGVKIQSVGFREADCTLDMQDFERKISRRTKIVAFGYAANAVGTINDVKAIIRLAHEAGALAYVDAVHYAPHGLIDVGDLDCDFLVCSSYKFFGPHLGILYGKREHLERHQPYKVRANTNALPQRWEWGTLNHEAIAGLAACIEYLAGLGRRSAPAVGRREALSAAYRAIRTHEEGLMRGMLRGIAEIPGLRLYGISDPNRLHQRCPTFAIRHEGRSPLQLATKLGEQGLFTWDGNYYAIDLSERLGVEQTGGFLRIGFVHYNTPEELGRLLEALAQFSKPE